jgi:PD-(D/E)XK nuclease superfamily
MTIDELEIKRASYPRVSEIIGKQNSEELRSVPIDTLANACIRGTKVHAYCTATMKGLWVSAIEDEYRPYVDAFLSWSNENVEEELFSSIRLCDDVKRFTGEFDMIVKLKDGKRALLDLKTSSAKSKTWPVQLSAYVHLCKLNGYEFDEVYNIHLKKVKPAIFDENSEEKILISPPQVKACLIAYNDLTPYMEIFSSALACYDYFSRKEPKQ